MVRYRLFHRRRAYVLMDALVALAVLGSGVFVALAFFRTEVREARTGHERLVAGLLAQSEIEKLRATALDVIPPGENQPIALTLPSAARLKECAGTLTVKEIEPGLKLATVRIAWSSALGRPLKVELSSEFSKEGSPQ